MAGVHVRPGSDKGLKCVAPPGKCPLKGEDGEPVPHFKNMAEADAYVAERAAQENSALPAATRKSPKVDTKELSQRLEEMNLRVGELEGPFKEARTRARQAEKELRAVSEAADYMKKNPSDTAGAKAILAANNVRHFDDVAPDKLQGNLEHNREAMARNLEHFKERAADLKEPLDAARRRRNTSMAKLRATNGREEKAKAERAEREKYILKADASRAFSKSDNLPSYGGTYRGSAYDPREGFEARFPNPKDADMEKVKQFSESAAAFLERNPYGGVVIKDRHGHAYSVPSIRKHPRNPHAYVIAETRFGSGRIQFSSSDIREVVTQAVNRYGYNEDEYDPMDVEETM